MDRDARIRRAILDEVARFQESGMDTEAEDTTIAFVAGLSIGSHLVSDYREAGQVLVEFLDRDLQSVAVGTEGAVAMAELDAEVKRLADAIRARLN
jgi:hypothetical protein